MTTAHSAIDEAIALAVGKFNAETAIEEDNRLWNRLQIIASTENTTFLWIHHMLRWRRIDFPSIDFVLIVESLDDRVLGLLKNSLRISGDELTEEEYRVGVRSPPLAACRSPLALWLFH